MIHTYIFVMFVYDMWHSGNLLRKFQKKLLHFFLLKYLLYLSRHENMPNLIMGNRFEMRTSTNYTGRTKQRFFANKEIFCKEKDAKENIP